MTIQNGDVGPPKLQKSLQCAMIRGQDVVVVVVVVVVYCLKVFKYMTVTSCCSFVFITTLSKTR